MMMANRAVPLGTSPILSWGVTLLPPTDVAANRMGMELPFAKGAWVTDRLVALAVIATVTAGLLAFPSLTVRLTK
jgi:hypothetical protein